MPPRIDTSFDFRTDTPTGRDPDSHSPTLREYHRILWSKELPDGRHVGLETRPGTYLTADIRRTLDTDGH